VATLSGWAIVWSKGCHSGPQLPRGVFVERPLTDTDVADIVLRQFEI